MSYTLMMRLTGPMQSWGVSSRFTIRETLPEPSKSGVIGLLCAALGWHRSAKTHPIADKPRTLNDLAKLRLGIRVIREGALRRDYQTAQNVLRAKVKFRPGKIPSPSDIQQTVLSDRYYLSDAYFLVGLESEDMELLLVLDQALANPYWPLSLGRKAFLPSLPIRFGSTDDPLAGIVNQSLAEALLNSNDPYMNLSDETLRFVCDQGINRDALKDNFVLVSQTQRVDVPLSFSPRRFAPRDVLTFMPLSYVSI
jgi:CRISPR system Cascade subunit CasD